MPFRWVLLGVFVLSSSLNYLDRMILSQLAPVLRTEFQLSNEDYGWVLAAFSFVYAGGAPAAGWFIDRVGLNRGISIAVGFWSVAGISTGLVTGLGGLIAARAALGLGEAAGVPAVGKAIRYYLLPRERALGNALSQVGLSVGAMAAPPLATFIATAYGWRWAFVVTGALGFVWIPLWNWIARYGPKQEQEPSSRAMPTGVLLRERRLWAFATANALAMPVYTLWSNWVTLFLVDEHGMRFEDTPWLAGIPPLIAPLGGFIGGWFSSHLIRNGAVPVRARYTACWWSTLAVLSTAAVPLMPSPVSAIAAIGFSYAAMSAFSVNLYTMPIDVFGPEHAALSVAMLTGAYGLMQAVFSPMIGRMVDVYGFPPVCIISAACPLVAMLLLRNTTR
jgi:ACS family hexuronate transporter-like MFS transporter